VFGVAPAIGSSMGPLCGLRLGQNASLTLNNNNNNNNKVDKLNGKFQNMVLLCRDVDV